MSRDEEELPLDLEKFIGDPFVGRELKNKNCGLEKKLSMNFGGNLVEGEELSRMSVGDN